MPLDDILVVLIILQSFAKDLKTSIDTIALPAGQFNPTSIKANGDRLYVVNAFSEELTVIDALTHNVIDIVPITAGHLAVSAFVANAPPAPTLSAVSSLSLLGFAGVLLLVAAGLFVVSARRTS